jgi:hypothetical protein
MRIAPFYVNRRKGRVAGAVLATAFGKKLGVAGNLDQV